MIVRIVFLLGIFSLLAGPSLAREIYVDNLAGDDRFSGAVQKNLGNLSGPVRTITRAIHLSTAGDQITLTPNDEPYRESITLAGNRHSGFHQRPLTINGNGAILDGSAPIAKEAWEHFSGAVFRFHPPHLGHGQLFIDNLPADQSTLDQLGNNPAKLPKLHWCLKDGHLYFCVEPDRLPSDYRLTCTHLQTGITLYHVRRVSITNLIVQGFQLDGISAFNSARNVLLNRIVARGNGRAGISLGGASLVELTNCTIGDNGRAQLLTLPHSQAQLDNCQLFANTAPAWVDRGGRVQIDGKAVQGGLDRSYPEPVEEPKP